MIDNRPAGLGAWLLSLLLLVFLVAPAFGQDEPAAPAAQPLEETPPTHGTEPSTWLLLATGLSIILLLRYQQQRRRLARKPQPMTRGQPRAPATSPSSR
jgi:hypothetical protein